METLEQKKRINGGKSKLWPYLCSLKEYFNGPIVPEDLLPIPETDLIYANIRNISTNAPLYQEVFKFDEKESSLPNYITSLVNGYDGDFFLVINNSDCCGAYRILGLSQIRLDFSWTSGDGCIVISKDFKKMIDIDWDIDDPEYNIFVSVWISK